MSSQLVETASVVLAKKAVRPWMASVLKTKSTLYPNPHSGKRTLSLGDQLDLEDENGPLFELYLLV